MTTIKNKIVLITGGASGIGKMMGKIVLQRGARRLIIWDVAAIMMEQTAKELSEYGNVATYQVDITDNESIKDAYQDIKKKFGAVHILINCAGIVRGNTTFDQQTPLDIELTMKVNAIAPMMIAQQILPDMLIAGEGHICNIASAAGLLSNPKMSVYAASKWAMIGWSDSMRIELNALKNNVHVSTIAPYFINTGMFDGVQSKIFPILKPEPTARKVIRAIERNRDFVGIPFGFHFVRFWQAILPVKVFDFLFGRVFGIFSAMDHFTGRKA